MGVLDDLLGQGDVVLELMLGAVDHDAGETAVHAGLAQLEGIAVIQMHADRQTRLDDGRLDQLHQVGVVGILAGACGNLQDQGSVLLFRSFGDALDDLHVVDVERADGIAVLVGVGKHGLGRNESHSKSLLGKDFILFYHIRLKKTSSPQENNRQFPHDQAPFLSSFSRSARRSVPAARAAGSAMHRFPAGIRADFLLFYR